VTSAPPKSDKKPPVEHEILFQNWFKSVGPRTYAAQLKKARNGNHFLVLTEGNRHKETGDIRKTRLFIYSEDFPAFFRLLHEAAVFIRENPVPEEVKRRQEKFWATQSADQRPPGSGRAPQSNSGEAARGRSSPSPGVAGPRPDLRTRNGTGSGRPERQQQSRPAPRPSRAMQPA
jgi:hypothetical protein